MEVFYENMLYNFSISSHDSCQQTLENRTKKIFFFFFFFFIIALG